MTINEQDVMAAKDGMIFDLTNQVLQLKAQLAALQREQNEPDENQDNGKVATSVPE